MVNIKEKYQLLKKKYSLPDYDLLNKDFDLEDINAESDLILQKIRLQIYDKLEIYAKMIEARLQPDSSLADLYEAHYVDDDEKNDAYMIFKKLMRILRYSNLISLTNKEEENAKFIKETYEEWNKLKLDIQEHLKTLLELWRKETDIKEDLNYFG